MSDDFFAASKKIKQHQKLLDDGIFHYYPAAWPDGSRVPNEVKVLFGVCPLCVCVGRNTATCYPCNSVTTFQIPMVYEKDPNDTNYYTYRKTVYRVDTLFFAVHMTIYNSNDPGHDERKDYTIRDPLHILVPPEKQGSQTCNRFLNELPTTLPYMEQWFNRAYPDPAHERHQAMQCLMTDQVSPLFEEETDVNGNPVYDRIFEYMFQEWKGAISQIRRSTVHSLEFLSLTGTGSSSDSDDSDGGNDDEGEGAKPRAIVGSEDEGQGAEQERKKYKRET